MKYDFHNHIRVFCNRFDLDRGSSEVKNLRNSFEQKEKFDKQTYEWLVGFLKCTSQKEAKSYVQQQLQELKEKKDLNPEERKKYEQQLKILSMWVMDKKLFPTSFFGKQNINTDSIKELQRGLGLSDSRIQELMEGEKQKRAEEWKNQPGNDIASYSKKILTDTLAHPMAVQRGKYLKVGEKLDFLSEISLYEEKRKIEKLGVKYLPEYHAVIMTLIAVTTDPKAKEEFDRYTGGFLDDKVQKWKGTRYNREDYRHGLEKILANAITSKIEQKPAKSLLETEQQENGRLAFEQLKQEVNIQTVMEAFKKGKNREEVKNALRILSTKMATAVENHRGNLVQDGYRQMEAMINTAYLASDDDILDHDNGFWSTIKQGFSGIYRDDYMKQLEPTLNKAYSTVKVVPISWNKEAKKFESVDLNDLLSNPDNVNIPTWKRLMSQNWWYGIMQEVDPKNIWVVGAYMNSMNWKTNLITQIEPEERRNEVKRFFENKLTDQKYIEKEKVGENSYNKELFALIQKDPYFGEYFNSIEDINKVIGEDGVIDGKELYSHLSKKSPNKFDDKKENIKNYTEFHVKFQKVSEELVRQFKEKGSSLEKTIEGNAIKTVKDLLKALDITKGGEALKDFEDKEIKILDIEQAKALYDLIKDIPHGDNEEIKTILDLLKNKINTVKAQKTVGANGFMLTKAGKPNGVSEIGSGDAQQSINAAGTATQQEDESNEQIRFLKENPTTLKLLIDLHYTPEDLKNPLKLEALKQALSKLDDTTPGKKELTQYVGSIAKSERKKMAAFDTIIRNEGREAAVGYISNITGKTETQATIDAYQYINRHVYQSVEYNQSAFTASIAKMNIGESRSIDSFAQGGSIFGDSYLITSTDRGVYTIKSASGDIVGKGLSEDQSEEVIEDMLLFASMGFGDLIPRLTDIKERVALKTSRDTKLNGKTSEQEQLWIMRPLYEKLFGVQSETLNIHDFDRELRTIGQTPEERKKSVRQKLKENNLMRQDNTLSSPDTIISFLKTL